MKQLASRLWNYKQSWLIDCCVIILLGFFLFMFGNQNYTLFDNSETHYSRVAQEMVQAKQYLTLSFNGSPWYVHPPLYFWLTGGLCSVFGWNEFTLRFWEGFFGILGLLTVYAFGIRFFNRKTGVLAAIILASSLYYCVIARLAVFDMMLNFFILLSSLLFLRAYNEPEKKQSSLLLAGLSTGIGILAKGPIALLHPGLVIFAFLAWKRDLKWLVSPAVFISFGLCFLVAAPWYGYEIASQGEAFVRIALKDYTWYRFLGVVEAQTGPWYFYFPVLLTFFPWIFFLPGIIRQSLSSTIWKNDSHHKNTILFSWLFIIITFIFFSIAKTKLPTYILSLFPFLSLLTAHYFLHDHHHKKLFAIQTLSVTIAGFCLWYFGKNIMLPPAFRSELYLVQIFVTIIAISTALFSYALLRGKRLFGIGIMTTGMIVLVYTLTHVILPQFEYYKDVKLLTSALSKIEEPYVVVNANTFSPYMKYYLNRNIQDAESLDVALKELNKAENMDKRRFLVLNRSDLGVLRKIAPDALIYSTTLEKAVVEL